VKAKEMKSMKEALLKRQKEELETRPPALVGEEIPLEKKKSLGS